MKLNLASALAGANWGHQIRLDPAIVVGIWPLLRHLFILGQYSARVRQIVTRLAGGTAVRGPAIWRCAWLGRKAQIYWRPLGVRNVGVLAPFYHNPGILAPILAWITGFAGFAFCEWIPVLAAVHEA
jgi:hypothetical protein